MSHIIADLGNPYGRFAQPIRFNVKFGDESIHRLHDVLSHVGAVKCGVVFTNRGCESCSKPVEPDGPIGELTKNEVTCDICKKYLK